MMGNIYLRAEYPMAVTSIGDCLEAGRYLLYTRFSRAAGYACGDTLMSLVSSTIGNGPNHIVTSDEEVRTVETVTIEERFIYLDEIPCVRERVQQYSSYLPSRALNARIAKHNLEALRLKLRSAVRSDHLLLPIDSEAPHGGCSSYEGALSRRIGAGIRALRIGDYRAGVRLLLGTGTGLTPSGDDFIAGFAAGLLLKGGTSAPGPKIIAGLVEEAAEKTHVVSRTMLLFACRGRMYERARNLLLALCHGRTEDVNRETAALLGLGHTSGMDFGCGLVCSLSDGGFR
jgi:hypothetical protein